MTNNIDIKYFANFKHFTVIMMEIRLKMSNYLIRSKYIYYLRFQVSSILNKMYNEKKLTIY
jgi:hypothetical protein